jgi:hypothetical protein
MSPPSRKLSDVATELADRLSWAAAIDADDELIKLSNNAVDLVHEGRLDEAEQAARDLIERFPHVYDGWDRLGMVHEARGRYPLNLSAPAAVLITVSDGRNHGHRTPRSAGAWWVEFVDQIVEDGLEVWVVVVWVGANKVYDFPIAIGRLAVIASVLRTANQLRLIRITRSWLLPGRIREIV